MTNYKKILALCKKLAKIAHYGQYRNDGVTRYIVHPEAVANSVSDVKMKCLAWLHDVVEDTPVTIEHLREQKIPEDILKSVDIMTKKKGDKYLEYILRCKKDYLSCNVKIADIKHNLSTLNKNKYRDKYDKYKMALWILTK